MPKLIVLSPPPADAATFERRAHAMEISTGGPPVALIAEDD